MKPKSRSTFRRERAVLVQLIYTDQRKEQAADSLAELERLTDTAGAEVVGVVTQRRERPTAGFFVGEGKLADIQLACREANADVVIFDNDLTSVQVNNIDLALGFKVIDRTELILQIFARRARSSESKIQVELAQLQYLISRIPVSEKQARFTGGIGMRGPGESPLQLRNAPMRKRIKELKEKLEKIQAHHERTLNKKFPIVSLVGYTNVGKSTLLNALSASDAYVDDRLFATLDTKTRFVHLKSGGGILLTDTVGFIRHLPHGLVASFRSTLSVAADSNLLLIVADATHPRNDDQLLVVHETLKEIKADKVPSLLVINKCDSDILAARRQDLESRYPDAILVSAREKTGLEELKGRIENALSSSNTYWQSGGYDAART